MQKKKKYYLLLISMIMIQGVVNACSSEEVKVRPSAVAGTFYPSDADTLRAMVESFYEKESSMKKEDEVQAVIVPHAGYVFSGRIAAKAFACIRPDAAYKRIFLLGPSHHVAFDGASVNNQCNAYMTPLGMVPVDKEMCDVLIKKDSVFTYVPEAHVKEHCLEVQLPLLQLHLNTLPSIVPIIVGTVDLAKLKSIARALQPYFTSENLFVISSDFSHYPSYEDANKVDKMTGNAIRKSSLQAFIHALAVNSSTDVPGLVTSACGQGPIAVLLSMLEQQKDLQVRHIGYCNSGDTRYGDRDRVVGYHAFSVVRNQLRREANMGEAFSLRENEKKQLLQIARKSIENLLAGKDDEPYDSTKATLALQRHCGAFVTLHVDGKLRGCIGNLVGFHPLYKVVSNMARAAAFDDPRFRPVTAKEMGRIDIEISVLSPLRQIHSIDDLQLGRHGIYIRKGEHSGTFLPQVAEETGWSKEEFLGHCARDKAGLSWNGWKDADLYVYEAVVFGEQK